MSSWKSLSSGEFLWNHLFSIIHQDQPTCELWRKILSKHVWDQEREHVKHSKLCKHLFKNWTKIEQKLNKIEPKLNLNSKKIDQFQLVLPLNLSFAWSDSMFFKDWEIFSQGYCSTPISINLDKDDLNWWTNFLKLTLRNISSSVCFCLRSFNFLATWAAAIGNLW